MTILLEAHLVLAFLVAFCAIIFSWNSLGLRVMNAVVGLQILLGIILLGVMGRAAADLSPTIWIHLLCAVAALVAYLFARRVGDRPRGRPAALILGAIGLILVFAGFYLGLHMAGRV